MININKLVRWNLKQPDFSKRVGYMDLIQHTSNYAMRGRVMALHVKVKKEIEDAKPELMDHWAL